MLSIYKRKVSLALKIETIARMDARAKADGSTRNEVAEYILASALAKVSRFLELSAMRDEAETFHKLFPGEREAWMPTEVLAQLLAVDSTGTEGRTLIRRLWQARAAVLTIEFEPIHGGGESQATMERWRLTLFFYTGSLMECFA